MKDLHKLHRIISRFKEARILVIGDVMLDRFIWGTVSRISPEAPVPVLLVKSESVMAGATANVANNICSLGGKVYICGVIGDDDAGRIVASEVIKKGINNEGLIIDPNRPTTEKTRIIAHHQQVVRVDKENNGPINARIIDKVLNLAEEKIKDVDAIILEDYGKGLVMPRLIKRVISLARRHNKIITVDPKQEHTHLYKHITSMTPNLKEAEIASGIIIKNEASLIHVGKKLLKKLHAESILITLGEDGMALFPKREKWVHIPTVAQEVFDVSGAGDTVIAIFTLARVCGASLKEAAYISNIAAGIVVGKLGVAVCSLKELNARLNQLNKYGMAPKKNAHLADSIFNK